VVFHGGISTQKTLPFGTPREVADETHHLTKTLLPKLVVAPNQKMIGRIPLKNIRALFETAKPERE